MERIVSPEERIRRAEEIYYRRKAQGVRVTTTSVNLGKNKKISLGKKMAIQIIMCLIIYLGFWMIKGYDNVFSDNVINQTKSVLSYDVNFKKIYMNCVEYFNNDFNKIIKTNNNQNEHNEAQNDELKEEQIKEENNEQSKEQNQEQVNNETNTENKTQMEQDAEYIKQNCNLIKPLEGRITSKFGDREETEIISAFHQGIDIGANTGTVINAAMEGTVVAASYAGDYGNHIKIQKGEVLTVYAHCSEINVNVGDNITQGQEIGKVGATGKVTGPHLHFELRRDGRYVDPEMILSF